MRIKRVILTCFWSLPRMRLRPQLFIPDEKAPDHQARGSKVCLENALRACPIEPWGEQSVALRMRPEAFRLAMNRGWDSIQHDGHHALLLEKKQCQLQINPLLTLGSYQRVSCV